MYIKKLMYLIVFCIIISGCKGQDEPVVPAFAPEPVAETTVTLSAVGDNLIHAPIYKQAYERGGASYDFSPVYENVAPLIQKYDISIINQETPLGGTSLGISSYPMFNSPQELGDDLIEVGFDVINHANNHIMDAGKKGVDNTLAYWKSKNIPVIGVYEKNDTPIKYVEKNGLTLAFLSYTYGTNGNTVPKDSMFTISFLDKQTIESEVATAKENADIVIVSMHWGDENNMLPNDDQRELAEFVASKNVDLLIGHHPHVLQPIETITRADNAEMVVAYSLGNFVSSQNDSENMLSGILTAEFTGSKGNTRITKVGFIPTITHYGQKYSNVKIHLWQNYTPELAAKHGCKSTDSSFSYNYMDKILKKTISEKYLTNFE